MRLVLALVFYLILTPAAFVLRRIGRDRLRLRPMTRPTYWIDRDPARAPASHFASPY